MTDQVIAIHRVADYTTWKTHFDAATELRRGAGEETFEVYRSADDPNVVVHSAMWSSLGAARSFFESPEVAPRVSGSAAVHQAGAGTAAGVLRHPAPADTTRTARPTRMSCASSHYRTS